jgi:hypothetical protein
VRYLPCVHAGEAEQSEGIEKTDQWVVGALRAFDLDLDFGRALQCQSYLLLYSQEPRNLFRYELVKRKA